jgi:hypothetical protein
MSRNDELFRRASDEPEKNRENRASGLLPAMRWLAPDWPQGSSFFSLVYWFVLTPALLYPRAPAASQPNGEFHRVQERKSPPKPRDFGGQAECRISWERERDSFLRLKTCVPLRGRVRLGTRFPPGTADRFGLILGPLESRYDKPRSE